MSVPPSVRVKTEEVKIPNSIPHGIERKNKSRSVPFENTSEEFALRAQKRHARIRRHPVNIAVAAYFETLPYEIKQYLLHEGKERVIVVLCYLNNPDACDYFKDIGRKMFQNVMSKIEELFEGVQRLTQRQKEFSERGPSYG